MAAINVQSNIHSCNKVIPMIYAYTTPEIDRHKGWVKIGYTEQNVDKRIQQQMHTADVKWKEEWRGLAVFEDGSAEIFHDTDFHKYLTSNGIERLEKTEWFHIDGTDSRTKFYDFKENRGVLKSTEEVIPYKLRKEQEEAVIMAYEYFKTHENGEFLWNAKPRFGKTLAAYDLCKKLGAINVLIVTNRPAIANSWYSDYTKFLGEESGYKFVSNTDSLKGKASILSRDDFIDFVSEIEEDEICKCIEFVSLQDLKGSKYFGGEYDKLREVAQINWDLLIIDEAHEGVDTYKTDLAFERIHRSNTLHLSGTPFKALANDKFEENAIYNWTYADEQKAKRDWITSIDSNIQNPYETLPKLNMFTYQMSEIIYDELSHGLDIDGETEEYAFDLNVFFETKNGKFVYDSSVDKFLDALTTQEKFPFSTEKLRNELKHTLWLLNRVESAKLLAKKLEKHPIFKDYKIVLAAGDGCVNEDENTKKSFDAVKSAIKNYDKTITLSVGQLTTGVTIPEWTAVLMLSNIKSPSLYMQAAFRAQNPCVFSKDENDGIFSVDRKVNSYVFDFDPARTLIIYEKFANDLSLKTINGHGDTDTRKEQITELLNFFPVIGEDENGEMVELNAEKVLSIPRKIKSKEVVRRGFMSNFLFQNIGIIFQAPREVIDIITSFNPVQEDEVPNLTSNTAKELYINEEGNVDLEEGYVIGKSEEIFGDKIFEVEPPLIPAFEEDNLNPKEEVNPNKELEETFNKLKIEIKENTVKEIINDAKEFYGNDVKKSDTKEIERELNKKSDEILNKILDNYNIETNIINQEHKEALENNKNPEKTDEDINKEFMERHEENSKKLQNDLNKSITDFVNVAKENTVKTIETNKKEREKQSIENSIKDHLRGFARTIPSFLMAYGTENICLENFDTIIPNKVFQEVTSISLEQFKFLRDGGTYIDENTGKEEWFGGNLFDSVVFNDSIKEFLGLKVKLSNYFDEESTEDIFDYIPPQKTNQIFTHKVTVKRMVDLLEEENPACFNDPNKTFIDLYMKSGLYITEIVKRLYQSEEIKKLYPDKNERLHHIFEKQVYGLAPTEIIYNIAINYILGFDTDLEIKNHNFRQVDALKYVKEGNLEKVINETYKEK